MGLDFVPTMCVIDLGTTLLGEVYTHPDHPQDGKAPLLGYLDPCSATAYVSLRDVHRFNRALGVEVHGHTVRCAYGAGFIDFAVARIDELDFATPVTTCATAVLKDFECAPASGCISLIDAATRAPRGSFRPGQTIAICTLREGAECVERATNVTIDLYANQNCTPEPPTPTPVTLALCTIS